MKILTLIALAFGIAIPTLTVSAEAEKSWWQSTKEQAAKVWEGTGNASEQAAQQVRYQAAAAMASAEKKRDEMWQAAEAARQQALQTAKAATAEAQRTSAEIAAKAGQGFDAAWNSSERNIEKAAQATKDAATAAALASANTSNEIWNSTSLQGAAMLEATKRGAKEVGDAPGRLYNEHKEGIEATATIATVVGGTIFALWLDQQIESWSVPPSQPGPYSNVPNPSAVGPGKNFSATQREAIYRENMARNGGVLKSDLSGKELQRAGPYVKGYTPSPIEAQVDHVTPRSKGGTNSSDNAQVLSREENLQKGATPP